MASEVDVGQKKMSKRARRKQPNDKNKWPQHPKIQSMDARHKAYVRVAGINAKVKETVDPKLDLMSPEVKFGRLLGGTDQRKRHAAVNKLKAYLRARCDILNEDGGLSEMDLLKLWKGLWFTLYMADKVPVQDELAKGLAQLLWCVAGTEEEDEYAGQAYLEMCLEDDAKEEDDDDDDDDDGEEEEEEEKEEEEGGTDEDDGDFNEDDITMEEIVNTMRAEGYEDESDDEEEEKDEEEEEEEQNDDDEDDDVDESEVPHCRGAHLASLFIRTFCRTVRREWGNMDKYRVDKFYTLVRMYLHEVFKYMASRHWNLGIIRLFNDALFEEILSQTPNGLRYHFIDIALDELAKVNSKAPMPLTEATILDTLEPYLAMCQTGAGDDIVQARCVERILEKLLDQYSFVSDRALEEEENEEKSDSLVFDQVHVGTIAQFIFELASDPETKDQYRKSLYDVHKKFVRRLKKVGKDVELKNEEDYHVCGHGCGHDHEADEDLSQDDAAPEHEIDEGSGSEDENTEKTTEVETKQSKKKRSMNESIEFFTEDNEPADSANERKKKRKQKKRKDARGDLEEAPEVPADNQGDNKKGCSKRVKADDNDGEEVITISLSEQKKAKKEEKKTRKKKGETDKAKNEKEKSSELDGGKGDRRVKFGKTNRSKSYKASMKALLTGEVPKTKDVTPEKGILRKTKHAIVTNKAGRKRAVNYF